MHFHNFISNTVGLQSQHMDFNCKFIELGHYFISTSNLLRTYSKILIETIECCQAADMPFTFVDSINVFNHLFNSINHILFRSIILKFCRKQFRQQVIFQNAAYIEWERLNKKRKSIQSIILQNLEIVLIYQLTKEQKVICVLSIINFN